MGIVKKSRLTLTCINFMPTNLNPLASKRLIISPVSPRWTPSGLTAIKVRSRTIIANGVRRWARKESNAARLTSIGRQREAGQEKQALLIPHGCHSSPDNSCTLIWSLSSLHHHHQCFKHIIIEYIYFYVNYFMPWKTAVYMEYMYLVVT